MAVIRNQDIDRGRQAFAQCAQAIRMAVDKADLADDSALTSGVAPTDDSALILAAADSALADLPRSTVATGVRYSLYVLEKAAPGPSTEVRVAPWGAIKILPGPDSDPHNLTPPDVLEIEPTVWLALATGVTTWKAQKDAGNVASIDALDDRVGQLLPIAG